VIRPCIWLIIGNGGASDVAAQVFEFVALIDTASHFVMQAKVLLVDTVLLRGLRLLAGDGGGGRVPPTVHR
jgi:hypothetical protein